MNYKALAKDINDLYGFNIIPLIDKKPYGDWKQWHEREMDVDDIDKLGWSAKTNGIGLICGVSSLRCIDFDGVKDETIVYEFLKLLGLESNYAWLVKSGNGFHVWINCIDEDNYLEGLDGEKSYYKLESRDKNKFDHLELRWKNCQTVLPPSLHPSGKKYEFVNLKNGNIPDEEPSKLWIGKVLEAIKRIGIIEKEKARSYALSNHAEKLDGVQVKNGKLKPLSVYDERNITEAVEFIKEAEIGYTDWMMIGFALASIGEEGRKHFVKLSLENPHYNDSEKEIDKKFDGFLKDYKGRTTLGSFYHIAEKYGWQRSRRRFWRMNDSNTAAIINENDLIEFLQEDGFGKYYLSSNAVYVKVVNNVAEEMSLDKIKDHINNYLEDEITEQRVKRAIKTAIIKRGKTLLAESALGFLQTLHIEFVRDTKNEAFFYYENCIVRVTKDDVSELPYSELNGVIWEKQKIKRSFKRDNKIGDYEKFIENVCKHDKKRTRALRSAIGYLLHKYKNPSETKAIIFIDEKLSDAAYGRSGKGLVAKGIKEIRNQQKIDGKNFSFDKAFTFQSVNLDTEIIFFDDVNRRFKFERLFSIIAEGLSVEKKNKAEFYIPYERSPKILIATNYSIEGNDDSSQDRQFVVEFTDFYNRNHKPEHDFKKLFFEEWDEEEFNRFDSFMLECCQLYLKEGLVEYEYVNLKKKKLIDSTCVEFAEYTELLRLGLEYNKKEEWEKFKEENPDYDKLPQGKFTKWIKIWAALYDCEVHERKSGKERYFTVLQKGLKYIPKDEVKVQTDASF